MAQSDSQKATSRIATVLVVALTVAALYFAKEIILPFCLAIFLSFILNPIVRRLERFHVPRVPAVLIVVLAACIGIGSAGWLVTDQVVELGVMLPRYKGNLIEKVRTVKGATKGKIGRATEAIQEISDELAEESSDKAARKEQIPGVMATDSKPSLFRNLWSAGTGTAVTGDGDAVEVKVVALPPSPLEQVQTWLGPLIAPLTTAGIVAVLTLFLLIQREDMRTRVLQLIGTAHLRATTEALDDATRRVSSLLRMQLIVNAIYGICVATGLYLIGVPNAFLWGVLGLLLRFLPYVGPWLVAALPITLSLAVFNDWSHVLMTVAMFIVLELLVNNVLEPWLYGASMGVSSVGIIVAAIFWTWLWGPIGLVLAMPFTVCLVVAGKYIPELRFITLLFGDQVTMTTEQRLYQRLLAQDEEEADIIINECVVEQSCGEVFNNTLIPTLCLLERDRHAGLLEEKQLTTMLDTLRDTISEHGETITADAETRSVGRVLCVPARDKADELTASMLSHLLREQGVESDIKSSDMLVAEIVEQAASADAIVISALPPGASRHARYLCKRLRASHPELPIVVGLWSVNKLERTRKRLQDAGASRVATDLEGVVREVKSLIRFRDRPATTDAA